MHQAEAFPHADAAHFEQLQDLLCGAVVHHEVLEGLGVEEHALARAMRLDVRGHHGHVQEAHVTSGTAHGKHVVRAVVRLDEGKEVPPRGRNGPTLCLWLL